MEFFKALLLNGVQFIVMGAVAAGAVVLGAKLRKAKTAKKEKE